MVLTASTMGSSKLNPTLNMTITAHNARKCVQIPISSENKQKNIVFCFRSIKFRIRGLQNKKSDAFKKQVH